MSSRVGWLAVWLWVIASVRSAEAQAGCPIAVRNTSWPAPLDRQVDFVVPATTLGNALETLGAASGMRLAWSSDLVPSGRRSCEVRGRMSVGDALATLLHGTGVEARALGGVDVALGPARQAALETRPLSTMASMLQPVLVKTSAPARPTLAAFEGNVISRRDIQTRDARGLAETFNGQVPGLWLWEPSSGQVAARYASLRGASSFGVSAPKIYIDGVETANPLLITHLQPDAIDRIEVIRGPQGAALFGADALSGVISITSRTGSDRAENGIHVRSSAGTSTSEFTDGVVATQRHELTMRAGSVFRAAGLSAAYNSLGAFVPGASSHDVSALGDASALTRFGAYALTARFLDSEIGYGPNPLLTNAWGSHVTTRVPESTALRDTVRSWQGTTVMLPQRMQQYSLSSNGVLPALGRWTPVATLGIDGYRLRNVATVPLVARSATDSAVQAAIGVADRLTARLAAAARFGNEASVSTSTTVSLEHSALHEETAVGIYLGAPTVGAWRASSGAVVRSTTTLFRTLDITTGLRAERLTGPGTPVDALLPIVGASLRRTLGETHWTLRSSYGTGIRAARFEVTDPSVVNTTMRRLLVRADLPPERQSGVDVSLGVEVPDRWSLGVTRFDQYASNLLQSVPAIFFDSVRNVRRFVNEIEGVGEIANRGWELEGDVRVGALKLKGTYTNVDSRVVTVAKGYAGDLRSGDRMLEVPRHTLGFDARWTTPRLAASLGITRAIDWINYDRLRMAGALSAQAQSLRRFDARTLRSYWLEYDGATRARGTVSYALTQGLALDVRGENLLGIQVGEPDNLSIVPGRAITLGLRVRR